MESCKHPDLNTKCIRCGTHFHCSCKDGCKWCWCFDIPKVDIPKEYEDEDCLCPGCINDFHNKAAIAHEQIKQFR